MSTGLAHVIIGFFLDDVSSFLQLAERISRITKITEIDQILLFIF
jgi:hypothetical protein